MPYRRYYVGYRGGRGENVVCTLDAGESAAAAVATLELSRCYSSDGTIHTRQQQEAARVRKSRLPSGSRKQLCFCLIQSPSLYKYLLLLSNNNRNK